MRTSSAQDHRPPVTPAVFSLPEFCTFVGISTRTGWRLVNTYAVPHTRPSKGVVRILKTDADTFLAARRVTCAEDARRLTDRRRKP